MPPPEAWACCSLRSQRNSAPTVYATVGNEAKAELARRAGADETIIYSKQDFEAEVKRMAGAVDVVYDSVGASTFEKSLNCLRPRGYMVLYGQSSGPVPPSGSGDAGRKGIAVFHAAHADALRA